jgi:hypothetical protein
MRKVRIFTFALLALLVAIEPAWPAANTIDPTSAALTDYLHHHRLPAVGAQVTETPDGGRSVMLYGFVATPKGKSDAELRTRQYLNDSSVQITNRIMIDPSLLAANRPSPSNQNQIEEYQHYGSSGSGGGAGSPYVSPPPNVGSLQAYQSQNPVNDPLNQINGLTSGLIILAPIVGGLLLYNALNSPSYYPAPYYGPPAYNPPPRYRGGGYRGPRRR